MSIKPPNAVSGNEIHTDVYVCMKYVHNVTSLNDYRFLESGEKDGFTMEKEETSLWI